MFEPIVIPPRIIEVTCPECNGWGAIEQTVDGADVEVICTDCGPPNLDGVPNSGRVEVTLPAVTLPEPTVERVRGFELNPWDYRAGPSRVMIDPEGIGAAFVGLEGNSTRWFELDNPTEMRALASALLRAADALDAIKLAVNGEAHPKWYRWYECACGVRSLGPLHPIASGTHEWRTTGRSSLVKPDWWPNP